MKSSFSEYVVSELMADISGVTSRAMFGGFGLYKDGKIFGMIANDSLYLKVNDTNRNDYEKMDSQPFTYENKGKKYAMSYWEVPQEIQDDPEQLKIWITRSHSIKSK